MFEVVTLAETPKWMAAFCALPEEWRDIHFRPDYYRSHETSDQRAMCAILRDDRGTALYPFLRCAITDAALVPSGEQWFDLQGALGYNGMAASTDAADFLAEFHRQFADYCRANSVVAEMTRLNPALGNERFVAGAMSVSTVNRNVIVDLTLSEEELWQRSYVHAARKQVKKGRRHGLATKVLQMPEGLEGFYSIFDHTMERNQAVPAAWHSPSYFERLAAQCPDGVLFYVTEHEGRPVAAELVSKGSTTGYSFLGGTLAEAFPLAANDVLKHDIILDLKRRGLRRYCLGGGFAAGDSIHRYKQKFSTNGDVDFRIAGRVHQPVIYQRLIDAWSSSYPERQKLGQGKILPYRF